MSAAQLLFSRYHFVDAHVVQLQTHLPASTMCALASGFDAAGPAEGAQHQALPPAADSAEREAPLRRITMQYKGKDDLREARHLQPAAMELLNEMQQALGSGTGLVLADTHASSYLHDPIKKIDCSGLAGDDCLWSQLVVPIEFKLYNEDANGAFGQLVETASIVPCQQPERGFMYAVSITMDTVELFCLRFGGLADFSSISSSSPLPLRLHQGSPGLRMLVPRWLSWALCLRPCQRAGRGPHIRVHWAPGTPHCVHKHPFQAKQVCLQGKADRARRQSGSAEAGLQ